MSNTRKNTTGAENAALSAMETVQAWIGKYPLLPRTGSKGQLIGTTERVEIPYGERKLIVYRAISVKDKDVMPQSWIFADTTLQAENAGCSVNEVQNAIMRAAMMALAPRAGKSGGFIAVGNLKSGKQAMSDLEKSAKMLANLYGITVTAAMEKIIAMRPDEASEDSEE
jgi:hypothetical protein